MYLVKSTKGYDLFISGGGEIVIDITYYGIKGVLSKNPTILSIRNALQR